MSVNLDSSFSDEMIFLPTEINPLDRLKEMEAKLHELKNAFSEKVSFYERSFQDLTHLAEKIIPATVFWKANRDYESMYSSFSRLGRQSYVMDGASGFVISPDGLIVTNYHVVEGASKVEAVFNATKKRFQAQILGVDPETDLALVKIQGEDFPSLTIGDSEKLKVGQKVAMFGNPLSFRGIMTAGVFCGIDEDSGPMADVMYPNFVDRIIADVATNPGNSGGPLVNLDGEVVGVLSCAYNNSGLGESIPSNTLKFVLDQLLDKGFVTRAYLGAELLFIDKEDAKLLGLGEIEGIVVMNVEKGSPSDQAGLQRGDYILKANGETFPNMFAFRKYVGMALKPGDEMVLSMIRNGEAIDLPVILGSEVRGEGVSSERMEKMGIFVDHLNAERAQFYGYDFGQEGVIISKLKIGSPAQKAGLHASYVITEVVVGLNTRIKVRCIEDLEEALKLADDQNVVILQARQPNSSAQQLYVIK